MRKSVTREPTVRELSILHQQIKQLAIADPAFVCAAAGLVNHVFGALLATGQVMPVDPPARVQQ